MIAQTWHSHNGLPILPETREREVIDIVGCCYLALAIVSQVFGMQVALATTTGYFGVYAAKMQPDGVEELRRRREGITRELEVGPKASPPK